jgi:hypothetical protein
LCSVETTPALRLQDAKASFRQNGCGFVLDGGFDVVYSALVLFHRDLPTEMKQSTFEIMTQTMTDLVRVTDQFINSSEFYAALL